MSLINKLDAKPAFQWNYEDFEVNLYEKEKELFYTTYKNGKELTTSKAPTVGNLSTEKVIKFLQFYDAIVDNDGLAKFYQRIQKYECEDKRISLLISDSLLWHIKNKENKSMIINFSSTVPSARCHQETVKLIDHLKNNQIQKESFELLKKDFKVTRVIKIEAWEAECSGKFEWLKEKRGYLGVVSLVGLAFMSQMSGVVGAAFSILLAKAYLQNKAEDLMLKRKIEESNDYCVEIEPISEPSIVDDRALTSKFTWSVTLITCSGCCGNHAQGVIEGINDGFFAEKAIGKKFTYIAHYNPPVESFFLKNKLKMETRSEIGMRPSSLVKEMIKAIEKQKTVDHPKLNRLGNRTIFPEIPIGEEAIIGGNNHNCFTWLRDQFKIADIIIDQKLFDSIAALAKLYTKDPKEYKNIAPKVKI